MNGQNVSGFDPAREIRAATARRVGASKIKLMERASISAATPRGSKPLTPFVPASARPHLQHHIGFGWDNEVSHGSAPCSARYHSFGLKSAHDLFATTTTPRTVEDPERERPRSHTSTYDSPIQPHSCHFMSWPGECFFVSPSQHHFRSDIHSRCDVRGDYSPMLRAAYGPCSRPDMPYHTITSKPPLR